MDPTDEAKKVLYRIKIAKGSFTWAKPRTVEPPDTTAYEGMLGPVRMIVIRYKINGIEMLGIPHGGFGYEGVVRTGMNVIHMPQEMAEDFFRQAEKQLSTA